MRISELIQTSISDAGNPDKAQWLENYVKHGIKSVGTGIPDIRKILLEFEKSENLWKARASLVPFAQSKALAKHLPTVRKLSAMLIQREERFCKTAVGWVLREISRIDWDFVEKFLSDYKDFVTSEVKRNAKKYM